MRCYPQAHGLRTVSVESESWNRDILVYVGSRQDPRKPRALDIYRARLSYLIKLWPASIG
jgi:hypothetical protein